jgi:membrane protein implicated in regulation of membrane protease activity
MLETVLNVFSQTSQLVVLLAIAGVSFVVLLIWFIGGAAFGADHEVSHDADHSGLDHSVEGDGPTVSLFSPRIFFVFTLVFGAAGSIACLMGCKGVVPSIWGLVSGFAAGLLAYWALSLLHKQQSNSLILTEGAVGKKASVTTSIDGERFGEVEVIIDGNSRSYMAVSKTGKSLPRGSQVVVVQNAGGHLIVEAATV